MSKTLIVPDIHDKISIVQHILEKEKWDRVVFEGDFFDDFPTGQKEATLTARYLKSIINDERFTFLLGNHDIHYLWPYLGSVRCSGYEKIKSAAVERELVDLPEIRKRFKLYCWVDDWLVSHAGVSAGLLPDKFDMANFKEWLETETQNCWKMLGQGNIHKFLAAGRDRGGHAWTGGLNWCDWNSFVAIANTNQLVGHSIGRDVRLHVGINSHNYCIDTNLRHYAIIEDGVLDIREVAKLPK
jgi:hypothetical protein